jgi:hypothetical protein
VKGYFYVDYAWDARGNGPASTVTEQGWKDMAARLKEAEAALEEAWKIAPHGANPLDARIAVKMMGVELGQGKGRERMELWFERAMIADADNVAACTTKMNYLEPKWHGSPAEMRSFGQACFRTGNWEARLPVMLLNAHLRLLNYVDAETKEAYYRIPEVREDLKSVLEGVIKQYPEDNHWRTFYVSMCVAMGDKTEALKQMKILGDKYSHQVYSPPQYINLRKSLEAAAAEK